MIRAGYALWALETTGWKADETTDAVIHYLPVARGEHDHWTTQSRRAPSESSNFTATALALRGLQAFAVPTPRAPANDRDSSQSTSQLPVKGAAEWRTRTLEWLQRTQPNETEDRVFRLWGLKYAAHHPMTSTTPLPICSKPSGPTAAGVSSSSRGTCLKPRMEKARWLSIVRRLPRWPAMPTLPAHRWWQCTWLPQCAPIIPRIAAGYAF